LILNLELYLCSPPLTLAAWTTYSFELALEAFKLCFALAKRFLPPEAIHRPRYLLPLS
jgi:hypothetical protein